MRRDRGNAEHLAGADEAELLAGEEGLPAVIVLNVAVRLQDEAGNSCTLILMA